jgi:hypothetical protein
MGKPLLIVTAAVEILTGLGLLGVPSAVARLLLGSSLETPMDLQIARVTGVALLALGAGCWLARADAGRGAVALITSMLIYNAGVAVLLIHGFTDGLVGAALWPAVVLHLVLGAWCVASLRAAVKRG